MKHVWLAAAAATAILWHPVSAQVRRPQPPISMDQPTPAVQGGTVASRAAYGERAGEGQTPSGPTGEAEGAREFGRPNPGRPAYEDAEYQGGQNVSGSRPSSGGQEQGQDEGENQGEGGGDQIASAKANVLNLDSGFFFDNYTSGSGFGVYGGEAVTSGSGDQSNPRQELPSAGLIFRNLGLPTGPQSGPAQGPVEAPGSDE